MKKYIIFSLSALPLLFGSCLKEDKDLFGESASARIARVQAETEQVLNAAPNGWQMKYYPSSRLQYGGIMLYMKFDNGKVTVVSEHGKEGQTAQSLYSYDSDAGATLNFDTYNELFHIYSEPNSGVGEVNTGMDGDAEFIIVSYSPEEVVLRGKRTGNTIRMTPLPAGDWLEQMKDYINSVKQMEAFFSYSLRLGGTTYEMYRSEDPNYPSRLFRIVDTAGNTIQAPYIYTNSGLEFYQPIVVDGSTLESFDWSNGKFINIKQNAVIAPVTSAMTLSISIAPPTESDVTYQVTPSNLNPKSEYYYAGHYKASEIDKLGSDDAVIRYLMDRILPSELASSSQSLKASNMKAETDYYILAIGVGKSGDNTLYPVTDLTRKSFRTATATPYEADYAAWLGTWTVTSTGSYNYETDAETNTPISFDITIEALKSNTTFEIYGWGVSVYRNEYPIIVTFNSDTNSFGLANDLVVNRSKEGSLLAMGLSRIPGRGYSFVGGAYDLLTVTRSSDTAGTATGYQGSLQGGGSFETLFCDYFLEDASGELYLIRADEGYTTGIYPTGPYTLTKKTASSPAARADATPAPKTATQKIAAKKEIFYRQ